MSSADELNDALTVLAKAEAAYGPDDPRLIAQFDELAEISYALGNSSSAEQDYLRSLKIQVQHTDAADPSLIDAFRKAAILFRIQDKFSEAENFYMQALKIAETIYGSHSLETAKCFNYLAGLHIAQSQYQTAEEYLRNTLRIYEQNQSAENLILASILFALALICQKQNKSDEAKNYEQRSADLLSSENSEETEFIVSKQLLSLALNYFQKQDYDKAEILFKQSFILEEEPLWPYSPLASAGDSFDEAEVFYALAIKKYQQAPNANSRELLKCLIDFSNFYHLNQRYIEEAGVLAMALEVISALDKEDDLASGIQAAEITENYVSALMNAATTKTPDPSFKPTFHGKKKGF
jgi:tetratricopeptide (TPR) repeat protein